MKEGADAVKSKKPSVRRPTAQKDAPAVKKSKMDAFTRSYVDTAIWADLPVDCDTTLVWPACIPSIIADCAKFQKRHRRLLEAAYRCDTVDYGASQAGGDFWLSRRGHGTGFTERSLGEIGEKLDAAAEAFGSVELTCGTYDQARWIFIE